MIPTLRGLLLLATSTFERQALSRKMLVGLLLVVATALLVGGLGLGWPWTMRRFGQGVALRLFGLIVLPAISVTFGAAALGEERDEKTLVYLLTRPLPRSGVFLAKFLAVLPVALGLTVGGLALSTIAATMTGDGLDPVLVMRVYAPSLALATVAYLALFHVLGAVFRHATLIGIAYAFFVEVFIGRLPGVLKRVSVSFYHWSMVYADASSHGVTPHRKAVFLPIEGGAAAWVLVGITVALLALGALLFARREHRDPA